MKRDTEAADRLIGELSAECEELKEQLATAYFERDQAEERVRELYEKLASRPDTT